MLELQALALANHIQSCLFLTNHNLPSNPFLTSLLLKLWQSCVSIEERRSTWGETRVYSEADVDICLSLLAVAVRTRWRA